MKLSALDYLACPSCHSDLSVDASETKAMASGVEEIMTGTLNCTGCSNTFTISGGIPRFVRVEWSGNTDIGSGQRFGDSWKRFSRLHDKYTRQFFDWMSPVTPEFVENKVVLDAGCGKGRHTAVISRSRAKAVVGVDIGSAIDVAYENAGSMHNVHIIQADLKRLPLKPVFDWICSTGVLHHMEQPETGFSSLREKLAPGGALSVWVYGRENNDWIINFVNPARVNITSRMPPALLHFVSIMLALVVYVYSRTVIAFWSALQKRVKQLPSLFYQDYLSYISHFDLHEIDHIVFDHLTAPVAYYLKREEVEQWYRNAGLANPIIRWHNKNSWSGFGTNEVKNAVERQPASDPQAAVGQT